MVYFLNDLCVTDAGFQIFGFLGQVLNIIKILVPIIIVIMGSVDLVKAIVAQKDDEMKKGYSTIVKRLIIGVIIFFIPGIVGFVIDLAGGTKDCESAKCVFNNSAKCISEKSNIILADNKLTGSVIQINGENYTFKNGDTISSVASNFGVSIDYVTARINESKNGECAGFLWNQKCNTQQPSLYRQ